MRGLTGDFAPEYVLSSYRIFGAEESHVTRICRENVLLLVLKGKLCFLENGKRIEVSAGEYYIQERGLQQAGCEARNYSEYYYIHFMGEFSDSDSPYLGISGKFDPKIIKELINAHELSKIINATKANIQASFLQIISVLANINKNKKNKISSDLAIFIMDNLKSDLSLEVLVSKFGYCKNSIIQIFKEEFKVTPHEYITQKRINLAKNLLISSNMPVEAIAFECGFVNYINLYKAFLKFENCSPSKYRIKNTGH